MSTGRIRVASLPGLALAVLLFLAVNLTAGLMFGSVRLDLTEGHIYTLSPVTAGILGDLKEPVRLRFYVSPALLDVSGQYANYAAHVRQLLDLYRRRAHGMLTYEVISPEPYSPEEDRAGSFGLKGVPVDAQGNEAFFGIVGTNSTDQTQLIPFLTPEREVFLEYDLTKMVSTLAQPKKQVVGLIDGTGGAAQRWLALEQARQQFTIRAVMPDAAKIDPEISVLMILHPKNLSPATQFAIDQFVLGGGHVLAFVDPDAESFAAQTSDIMAGGAANGGSSDLPALFKAWGIAYDPAKVVADWSQAMRIAAESGGRQVVTEFPPYIADKPPYLRADDPVTGDLKTVDLVTPGALSPLPGAKTSFTPLMQTSPRSALVDAADTSSSADPLAFLAKYQPGDQTYTLAARIVGTVATAFPDGPPRDAPQKEGAKPAAEPPPAGPFLKQSARPVDIIVAADVDMLENHSWAQVHDFGGQQLAMPYASNGDFLANALENLTGSPALSSLRARGVSNRPLTRIEDLQRVADDQYRATEESLSQKLEDARRQLLMVMPPKAAPGGAPSPLLSDQQQETMKRFRAEMAETRDQLRDVQHNLRRDIDRLERRIKFINIILVPLAVTLFSLFLAFGPGGRGR